MPTPKRIFGSGLSWALKLGLVAALGAWAVLLLASQPQSAQQRFREPAVKVTGIASNGTSYTITADGPLTRAQTFQTEGWFHVVIVNGQTDLGRGAAGGVRLQRISESLEILIPVKPGASVTVNPRGNRLDLSVEGGSAAVEGRAERAAPQQSAPTETPRVQGERAAREAAFERGEREALKRSDRAQQLTGESQSAAPKKGQASEAPAATAPESFTGFRKAPASSSPRRREKTNNAPATATTTTSTISVVGEKSVPNRPPPSPPSSCAAAAGAFVRASEIFRASAAAASAAAALLTCPAPARGAALTGGVLPVVNGAVAAGASLA
ncbi:MAG TPA: hypothetical protein VE360_10285 [Pyrinomonadaceae bacterium]|nr:hypothetical protein [Pyrinomonadaceae bacterium]